MGLHTGEPQGVETGYVGMDVHRAARICATGHGGQILLSEVTQALVAKELPEGVSLRNMGEHRLKDLAHPHRLFQILVADLPTEFPPLKSLNVLPNNLPIQLTSFIGREREMVNIKTILAKARLLTLTGAGGSGKTRLALQVGADLLEQYPDGVWLVDLALADAALVPQTVASAMGVTEQLGRVPMDTLLDALRPKSLLLLLDNCEHLLTACARLADALPRNCPNLRILATSRESLGIAGETLYPVPTLPSPNPEALPPMEELTQYEAVRLFAERATAVLPTFRVTPQNARSVVQVCHQLDGIPLAIELAAVRVKVLTAEEIARRLRDQFKLLTGGSRAALPRHQTLKAAIDWSYDLLSEQERALLRQLSVFAGGWTLEAAEAICACEGDGKTNILGLLARLVDKSLVIADEREGKTRYRLLETVRQYSQDRLLEQGDADAVRKRHRDFFLALGEEAGPHFRGGELLTWLNRLEGEQDNLRAALEWSHGGGDPEFGLRLAVALWPLWRRRGHFKEARKWLEATLAPTGTTRTKTRASALRAAGTLAREQEDTITARERIEESIAISRELDDRQGLVDALLALGHLPQRDGDAAAAAVAFGDALSISRAIGYGYGIAEALRKLGHVARMRGDHAQARTLIEESIAKFRESGDRWGLAHPLPDVGREFLRQGDYAKARSVFEESLTIFRELRGKSGMAMLLSDLGYVAAAEGDYATASLRFDESLAFHKELGAKPSIIGLLTTRAEIAQRQGDYEKARAFIDEAMGLSKEASDKWGMARSLHTLGNLARRQQQYKRAEVLFRESLTLFRDLRNKAGVVVCLERLAIVEGSQMRSASAARLLGAAESLRQVLGIPLPPPQRDEYAQTVFALRTDLGEDTSAVAWNEGRAMTLEQAIEYALKEDE